MRRSIAPLALQFVQFPCRLPNRLSIFNLGKVDQIEAWLNDRLNVLIEIRPVQPVHADNRNLRTGSRRMIEGLRDERARASLTVGGYGVLQVKRQGVGVRSPRLVEQLRPGSRHKQLAAHET